MLVFFGSTLKSATRPVMSDGPMLLSLTFSNADEVSRSEGGVCPEGVTTAATQAAAARTKVSRCFMSGILAHAIDIGRIEFEMTANDGRISDTLPLYGPETRCRSRAR